MCLCLTVSVYQSLSRGTCIHSHGVHIQVIVLHDTSLTFSRELECIWKRQWSAATALFVLNRYSAVALSVFNIAEGNLLPIVCPVISKWY